MKLNANKKNHRSRSLCTLHLPQGRRESERDNSVMGVGVIITKGGTETQYSSPPDGLSPSWTPVLLMKLHV